MFEIDKIPASIYDSLAAKGVARENILLGAYCDRNREHEPQDVYLLATSKELWVLFGVIAGKHSHSGHSHHHYEAMWEEADCCTYPLDSISRFQIEELIYKILDVWHNQRKQNSKIGK